MSDFYSATGLLDSLDRNGEKPELYIVCSRVRGPGKTFSFTHHLMKTFMDGDGKFILLARTRAELGNVADGMMKEMLSVKYPGWHVSEKKKMNGTYSDVYVETESDGEKKKLHCGYIIPLNAADAIKKVSSMFTDAVHAYFDEFQPEYQSTYLIQEVEKFKSIHTSVARGGGSSRRHFPVYMSSNAITVTNPYFVALGLTQKIQSDTKKFRGDGYVYQRTENPGLAAQHDESAMSRAFSGLKSSNFSDNSWVNDSKSGVGKPTEGWGAPVYIATLDHEGHQYGLYSYPETGFLYISHSIDPTHYRVFRMTVDGEVNLPLLKASGVSQMVKDSIERGLMRYHTLSCKQVAFAFLV